MWNFSYLERQMSIFTVTVRKCHRQCAKKSLQPLEHCSRRLIQTTVVGITFNQGSQGIVRTPDACYQN
jgi:hypothetical protein